MGDIFDKMMIVVLGLFVAGAIILVGGAVFSSVLIEDIGAFTLIGVLILAMVGMLIAAIQDYRNGW